MHCTLLLLLLLLLLTCSASVWYNGIINCLTNQRIFGDRLPRHPNASSRPPTTHRSWPFRLRGKDPAWHQPRDNPSSLSSAPPEQTSQPAHQPSSAASQTTRSGRRVSLPARFNVKQSLSAEGGGGWFGSTSRLVPRTFQDLTRPFHKSFRPITGQLIPANQRPGYCGQSQTTHWNKRLSSMKFGSCKSRKSMVSHTVL